MLALKPGETVVPADGEDNSIVMAALGGRDSSGRRNRGVGMGVE